MAFCNRYAGSDGTTREESQAQKALPAYESGYDKSYGPSSGNTNKGTSYWVSPEGQRLTLTWVADERGFIPQGDHLPVPPVDHGVAPEPVALPYKRTGLGF